MTAPTIQAAEAPFTGQNFGALAEALLRAHGLTNPAWTSTDSTFTSASTQQVAEAKQCVQEGLSYLQTCRQQWFPMSEDDTTADTPYTRAILPLDFGSFGKGAAYIAGVKLQMLNPEQYAANVRKDSEGGGVTCAEVSGEPTHARLVLVPSTETAIVYYRWALDVFPRQAAAWTAHVVYQASAKAITSDTVVVRVPVVMHPILESLMMSAWRKKKGDAKGAAEFRALAMDALQDIDDTPGDAVVMRATSALPVEHATRRG